MLALEDIYTLGRLLKKGMLEEKAVRTFFQNGEQKDIRAFLVEQRWITESQWDQESKEARMNPEHPLNPYFTRQENSWLFKKLRSFGIVKDQDLQQALKLCEEYGKRGTAVRLHEVLLHQKKLEPGKIAIILGIEKTKAMECPNCSFQTRISHYYPWRLYPCIFCGKPLQPLEKTQNSFSHDKDSQTTLDSLATKEVESPLKLGRYELLEKIGEGGMGMIYKVWDPLLKKHLALKMMSLSQKDPTFVERFEKEIQISSGLHHKNIISFFDVGVEKGYLYYTMEYVDGENLRDYRIQKKLTEKQALEIMIPICKALLYAHEQGVIHRDLKPENIMITKNGKPLLMDFGIAKSLKEDRTKLTQTGSFMGSIEYMAPEQAEDSSTVTFAADIYGLGGILFFLLTGRPPFKGKDALNLLHKIATRKPPSPRSFNPLVRKDVETIVLKCLAKNPKDRYSHVGLLLHDLQAVLDGRPIMGRSPGIWSMIKGMIILHPYWTAVLTVSFFLICLAFGLWLHTLQKKIQLEEDYLSIKRKMAKIQKELKIKEKELKEKRARLVQMERVFHEKKEKMDKEIQQLEQKRRKLENLVTAQECEKDLYKVHEAVRDSMAKGNYYKAIKAWENYLNSFFNKGVKPFRAGLVYNNLAALYLRVGNPKAAYEALRNSRKYGRFPEQIVSLAYMSIHYGFGSVKEAKKDLETFLENKKWPNNLQRAEAYYLLAQIYAKERKIQLAIEQIRKGLQFLQRLKPDPRRFDYGKFYLFLGKLYLSIGKKDLAFQALQRGKAYPYFPKTKRLVEQELQRLEGPK